MTEVDSHVVNAPRDARVDGDDTGAVVAALTSGLYLAATPTFAIMALLTSLGGGDADLMCATTHGAWPLSGMVPMYVLMSAFHAGPWLKRILRR